MAGGMRGRGCVWWRAYMAGGMCMVEGMHGGGVWGVAGDMCGRGMYGGGACMAGDVCV